MSQQPPASLDLASLATAYRDDLSVMAVAREIVKRIAACDDGAIWISRPDDDALIAVAKALDARRGEMAALPLFGIPFAVKDNIDVAGLPTTAACPAFSFMPIRSATVVERLIAAGAFCVGKTNLDQFATGLVGTRSPYGAPRNSFDERYTSGGSSSGSGVAVARGLVSFSLGTDTAGSGRVPAAYNNIVGLKPTRGALSTSGVVPACRSLDCVSIFALTVDDAMRIYGVAVAPDAGDPFSRSAPPGYAAVKAAPAAPRVAVPRADQLNFFGNDNYECLWRATLTRLAQLGITAAESDIGDFLETARQLYSGPWVAERTAAVGDFIAKQPDAVYPVTREIIAGGAKFDAASTFRATYRLEELRGRTAKLWRNADILMLPTVGTIYTREQIEAEPIALNSNLGAYTNFMNLLDLCGLAVPAGFGSDGLPFGITLAAPAWAESRLAALGDRLHRAANVPAGATKLPLPPPEAAAVPPPHPDVVLAVCGAHMTGLPLSHELVSLGAHSLGLARTAPAYRLYRLPGGPVMKPGLVRGATGAEIEVELWSVPVAGFGSFVARIPAPLGIGTIELTDGRSVKSFLCEAEAVRNAEDISRHGGWRNYLAALREREAVSPT